MFDVMNYITTKMVTVYVYTMVCGVMVWIRDATLHMMIAHIGLPLHFRCGLMSGAVSSCNIVCDDCTYLYISDKV